MEIPTTPNPEEQKSPGPTSDTVTSEMLRQALIDLVPDSEVVAGRICLAAMRRAGREADYDGNRCYYAAEVFSTNCLGTVSADGVEVTDSLAEDGACLRVQEVDVHLSSLEGTAGPIDQR